MDKSEETKFTYEQMYEWFAVGNRGTIQEVAGHFDMEVPTAYAFCNYIAGKYQVPLYSNGGVYAIRWDVDESAAVANLRAKDVAARMKKGVQITVDNLVEMIGALPPAKRAKYLVKYDMFVATCKFLVKQAEMLMLEAPEDEEPKEE